MSEQRGIDHTGSAEKIEADLCWRAALLPAAQAIEGWAAARLAPYFGTEDDGDSRFYHTRIGSDGQPWQVPKLRTMSGEDVPELNGLTKRNPRVVSKGAELIRHLAIDELPQIACLGPRLSMVGPRDCDENSLDNLVGLAAKRDKGAAREWVETVYRNPQIRHGLTGPLQMAWLWHDERTPGLIARGFRSDLRYYLERATMAQDTALILATPPTLAASALAKRLRRKPLPPNGNVTVPEAA